ncbi:MAG: pyrrolo-quinoline quinone [Polyangiaceae bacterium]
MGWSPHLQAVSVVGVALAACGGPAASNGGGDASVPTRDGGGTLEGGSGSSSSGGSSGGGAVDSGSGSSSGSGSGSGGEAGSSGSSGSAPTTSVLTYHNDEARTGQYTLETSLTPSSVGSTTFGKLFAQPVDSYIYAEPLFLPGLTIGGKTHDVVFVVTEANSVYAFDADTAQAALWHTNVGTALSCSDLHDCGDLVPGAGITGTPVIDPSSQTMYLVALTKDSAGAFHHRFHAIDITSGAERTGSPVEVSPTAAGTGANSTNGTIAFDPGTHYQRCALLLTGGVVYVGIGSNAESDSDNHGWIVGYGAGSLASTISFCASPNDNWSSLWQSGGGLSTDANGYVYAETANGTFDVDTGGSDYGDSAIKLDASGQVVDYFTPYDQADMNSGDLDFGAANPVVLPDQSGAVVHELLATGKPGILYLIDRDDMGHFQKGSDSQIVQSVSAFPNTGNITGGIFSSPVYWNGNVYVAGMGSGVELFTLTAGKLSTTYQSKTSQTFGFPGATTSVSSNGTAAGIAWVLDGSGGVLYAYDATNLAKELYDTTQAANGRDQLGAPVKFAVPAVANGHVYVGTQTELDVLGLLP